jgi:hypothetical protein
MAPRAREVAATPEARDPGSQQTDGLADPPEHSTGLILAHAVLLMPHASRCKPSQVKAWAGICDLWLSQQYRRACGIGGEGVMVLDCAGNRVAEP